LISGHPLYYRPVRGRTTSIEQLALRAPALPLRFGTMRDRETIDSELRLLAAVRRSIREHGGEPSSRQVDELLDEWIIACRPTT
jgi:hypothetical protein